MGPRRGTAAPRVVAVTAGAEGLGNALGSVGGCVKAVSAEDAVSYGAEEMDAVDVVFIGGTVPQDAAAEIARRFRDRAVVFLVGRGKLAKAWGVRHVPADPAAWEAGGLRTRLNAAVAALWGNRRTTAASLRAVVPAPATLDPVLRHGVDGVVFLGSSGAPGQLEILLPNLAQVPWPMVLVVHHPPSHRASFRSFLARLWKGPVDVADGRAGDLWPGMFVVPAPLGSERPGPDLDRALETLVGDGARILAVVGSGMGEEGIWGLRRVREQGGAVVAVDPSACPQPSMVTVAQQEGLVDATLPLAQVAALLRRVSARDCTRRGGARTSPAA